MQGVSTRKVKEVTEALCGHSISASSTSAINKTLDESLKAFSERRLADPFPYLILDTRYERIREGRGHSEPSRARGRRLRLGRPSPDSRGGACQPSWRDFLLGHMGVALVKTSNPAEGGRVSCSFP